jgi:hypothetical protein
VTHRGSCSFEFLQADLKKLFRLMKAGGYRGYVPIETLSQPGKEYDPFTLVPQFLREVRQAIAET